MTAVASSALLYFQVYYVERHLEKSSPKCASLLLYSLLCWRVVSSLVFYALSGNAVLEFANLVFPGKMAPNSHSPRHLALFSERKHGVAKLALLFHKKVISMDLEDVFCSKLRMKILKLLFKLGQLNTSDLAHRVGANYAATLRHLALLEKEGVVQQRLSGKTRFFRFANTLKARAILNLLEEWN